MSEYWRSLRELHEEGGMDELKAKEFMAGVTDDFSLDALPAISRKKFLALLSASAAFAAAGCSNYRDKGEIVPYTKKPEEIVPGVATFYASTCTGCTERCGVLIKTREGRPVKLEGNPDHPVNRGTLCARGQASLLGMYDPARLRSPMRGSGTGLPGEITWETADREIRKQLQSCGENGKQIALVSAPVLSPGAAAVLREFTRAHPTARLYAYHADAGTPRRSAWEQCYGTPSRPGIAWERAKVIVALESDFLGSAPGAVEATRRFAEGRNVVGGNGLSRLYAIEGAMTLTGANADYRMRLAPDAQGELVLALLREVGATVPSHGSSITLQTVAERHGLSRSSLDRLVRDLQDNRGRAIVHAGDELPEGVHVAVNYLNEVLGNSALYEDTASRPEALPVTDLTEMGGLIQAMKSGAVGAVIHVDCNPAYDLPRGLGYAAALASVPFSVSLAEMEDETGRLCTYVLPVHTMFESWGDHQSRADVLSLQQPVIAPLYDTRQKEGFLLSLARDEHPYTEALYRDFLKERWQREVYPAAARPAGFDAFWKASLHDGVVTGIGAGTARSAFNVSALPRIADLTEAGRGYTVLLRSPYFIGEGRFANNGWLQELPHPVSKIVWDNYAAVSPATAAALGVKTSDCIEIATPEGKQTLPVFVQPGEADRCIAIELGYGRWNAGPIGTGVGTDASVLIPRSGTRVLANVRVARAGTTHELVSTQEHHALDDTFLKEMHLRRGIIREGSLSEYENNPDFLKGEEHPLTSISTGVEYKGLKWAMSIDLNKCTGCNACASACNVENNIPVVGKDQVKAGREMQWIRIDRYYAGTDADPRLSHQPMLCQHCDQAPCENVCPVVATTHSPDGLNQMVYNRCVGTKYCSNNCPYKVRRFNFYNFRDHMADGYYEQDPVGLMYNPDVTVRSRGVMEKCTFCIQRIMEARQHAAEQGVALKGSDVTTACQQTCPARAIEFGDMNDPQSIVAQHRTHPLGYRVIEEVNARPNITYLTRLRNIHPEKLS